MFDLEIKIKAKLIHVLPLARELLEFQLDSYTMEFWKDIHNPYQVFSSSVQKQLDICHLLYVSFFV